MGGILHKVPVFGQLNRWQLFPCLETSCMCYDQKILKFDNRRSFRIASWVLPLLVIIFMFIFQYLKSYHESFFSKFYDTVSKHPLSIVLIIGYICAFIDRIASRKAYLYETEVGKLFEWIWLFIVHNFQNTFIISNKTSSDIIMIVIQNMFIMYFVFQGFFVDNYYSFINQFSKDDLFSNLLLPSVYVSILFVSEEIVENFINFKKYTIISIFMIVFIVFVIAFNFIDFINAQKDLFPDIQKYSIGWYHIVYINIIFVSWSVTRLKLNKFFWLFCWSLFVLLNIFSYFILFIIKMILIVPGLLSFGLSKLFLVPKKNSLTTIFAYTIPILVAVFEMFIN
jgi:hypothetical protein